MKKFVIVFVALFGAGMYYNKKNKNIAKNEL